MPKPTTTMPTLGEWITQSLEDRFLGEQVGAEKEGGTPFRVTKVEFKTLVASPGVRVVLSDGKGNVRIAWAGDPLPEVL